MLLTISNRQDLGCANLKLEFTSMFCRRKVFHPAITVFSDDNADNIEGANQLGITSILVKIKPPSRTISRRCYAKNHSGQSQAPYPSTMGLANLLWQRIDEDNMTTLAGNLAYVSLLSLVPLVAVVFALFAAFPMFSDVSIQLRHFIFANFLPATGDVIQRYIEQFVANSNKITAVGHAG